MKRVGERAKETGFGKPSKKTEGCHSSTAQAVRLSSGVPSKMQPAPYGLLGSAISREELPACLRVWKYERMCDCVSLRNAHVYAEYQAGYRYCCPVLSKIRSRRLFQNVLSWQTSALLSFQRALEMISSPRKLSTAYLAEGDAFSQA